MAIEVKLTGEGRFKGAASAISDYSVSEEATPIDASDSSGSISQITFNAVDDTSRTGSNQLVGTEVSLTDDQRGTVTGKITSLSSNGGLINVTADSRLGATVTNVDANPYNGILVGAITYYLSLANIVGDISVDPSLANIAVLAPSWRDEDLWTKIKELLTVYNAEIIQIGNVITVRPIRTRILTPKNAATAGWELSNTEVATKVEVMYYNTSARSDYFVYPENGKYDPDVTIYTVDAEEVVTYNIPVNMFLDSVEQPTPVNARQVPKSPTTSIYSVTGSDGYNVTVAQWNANGGKLETSIGEDGRSIDVTITGAGGDLAMYAPFRIAEGDNMNVVSYASLYIRASGLYFKENSVVCYTGAGDVATDIGVTVENPFIRTRGHAWEAAMAVARRYAEPIMTVSRSASKAVVTGGSSTFGNLVGSRFKYRRSMYRVKSTTISASGVDYDAEADTTFSDFNSEMAGKTFADFTAMYAGMTFKEFSRAPLPNPDMDNDRH